MVINSTHLQILILDGSCYNVHMQGYIQSYCVHYHLTHEHKGTQWRGHCSYVEDHYQKVQLLERV